jgi:outer membrane protein
MQQDLKRLAFVFLIIVSLAGAVPNNFSLDSCFQAALKQSEVLADQQEQIIQAEEHYSQALAVMLPNVNANGTYFAQDTVKTEQTTYKVSATQPLFRGFRDFAALHQNQSLITAQKQAYRWAALQLYSDTAQAFYLVLLLEKDLEHLNKETKLYAQRIEELQDRVNLGRSRQTEVLTVQVAKATLQVQIEQTQSQLATARELLAFLTGLPVEITLDDQALTKNIQTLEQYAFCLKARPDLLAAQEQVAAASQNVAIADGAYWPNVDLGGNVYLQRPQGALQDSHWDTQLTITLPVFSSNFNPSKQTESRSQLRQSQLTLTKLNRQAEQNLQTTYHQLQYDLRQTKTLQEAMELAEKNYHAVLQDYGLGLVTNLDVLQALVTYQDTARSLSKAEFTAKTDLARLQALTAQITIPEVQK